MNKFLSSFMLSVAVYVFNSTHAMEIGHIISVPEEFSGHRATPFQKTVTITDKFDPNDYQQNKHRNEQACNFNSMIAGIMHTEYGRRKVQETIIAQDENYVGIRFYCPTTETLAQYDWNSQFNAHKYILEDGNFETAEEKENFIERMGAAKKVKDEAYAKILNLPQTTIRIPKNFVFHEDKPSFPHKNPEWLNLMQQAYMMASKVILSFTQAFSSGYTACENIDDDDCFACVPHCILFRKVDDESLQKLEFFPLVDIPLKTIEILLNEDGLNLQHENQSTVDFVNSRGLSKNLLMASNVIQMGTKGHAVALFFGEGKVHYYDNVYYLPQKGIYGVEGPVYEEAKFFKGHNLNAMEEEEFFNRLFQEISYRLKQVTDIRDQEPVSETTITFFERPLVDLQY